MTDWNSIENQLRTWTPRQPSPELRRSLFPKEPAPRAQRGALDFARWLVPALGCFLLASSSLDYRFSSDRTAPYSVTNRILPSDWQEQSRLAYAETSRQHHSGVNSVPRKSLEWSVDTRAASVTPAALLISYTNKLIQ